VGTHHQPKRKTSTRISCGLGETTNNTAEDSAVYKGLNLVKQMEIINLHCISSSKGIIMVNGEMAPKGY